jgi:hypothetical protein
VSIRRFDTPTEYWQKESPVASLAKSLAKMALKSGENGPKSGEKVSRNKFDLNENEK